MLVGGLWALVSLRKSIVSGVKSGLAATRAGADAIVAHTERDLPMKWVLIGIVLFTLPLARPLLHHRRQRGRWPERCRCIMVIAGFLFCSVSAYMAGLVGSSNNPVSGITIATILFAALRTAADARQGLRPSDPWPPCMIGAVVCCAACVAGDNLQDLKAGYIVGATPWRQQVMLAIGSISCALVMAPTLQPAGRRLRHRRAEPTAHPNPLLAPQATLMAIGGQRHVRRRIAVGHGGHRRRHRRRHHRVRRNPEARAARRSARRCWPSAVGIYLPLETHGSRSSSAACSTTW